MLRRLLRPLPALAVLMILPVILAAQSPAPSKAEAEIRDAVRRYDAALRQGDTAAVGRFFAPEYTFVNARGERLTRADRLANLGSGRTTLDSLAHAPEEVQIRTYGDVAVHSTLITLTGRYSGKVQQGRFRALVVWVRRDGRWQQVASQLTQIAAP